MSVCACARRRTKWWDRRDLNPHGPFGPPGPQPGLYSSSFQHDPSDSGGPPRIATGTPSRGLRPERSVSCVFHQRAKTWRSRRDLNPRRPGVAGPHALSKRAPSTGLGHGSSKVVGAAGIEPTTCTRHPSLQPGVDYQHHSNAPGEWCARRESNPQTRRFELRRSTGCLTSAWRCQRNGGPKVERPARGCRRASETLWREGGLREARRQRQEQRIAAPAEEGDEARREVGHESSLLRGAHAVNIFLAELRRLAGFPALRPRNLNRRTCDIPCDVQRRRALLRPPLLEEVRKQHPPQHRRRIQGDDVYLEDLARCRLATALRAPRHGVVERAREKGVRSGGACHAIA
jgi:hypothetical protein